jgi:hypothetical protein
MTAEAPVLHPSGMVDLAPEILRQRLVIEGLVTAPIGSKQIRDYLSELSEVLDMVTLLDPVTHQSDTYGWAGWIHWETSTRDFFAATKVSHREF